MLKTGVLGFGNVGRELVVELLKIKNIELRIIASSNGYVELINEHDYFELIDLVRNNLKLSNHSKFEKTSDSYKVLIENNIDIAFIAIPPSYETGEPNRRIYYELISNNISIITADKTVLALEYIDFMNRVFEKNLFIGYRATVSAGTPVTDVVKALRNRGIERIRGVLNSTCNYILSLIEKGLSYKEAVNNAIMNKYAEPDPRIDTHGWDSGAKLSILASINGYKVSVHDVVKIPLDNVSEYEYRNALRNKYRYKYLAEADFINKKYIVQPVLIPINEYIANIPDTHNIVEIYLENDKVVVEGPAGPAWRTARVMVTDLFDYYEYWKPCGRK